MTYVRTYAGAHFNLTHEERIKLEHGEKVIKTTQAKHGDFQFILTMETIHLFDKKGNELHAGDSVIVIDPVDLDDWQHEFQGTVTAICGKTLTVTDQEDNYWNINSSLKVIKEK